MSHASVLARRAPWPLVLATVVCVTPACGGSSATEQPASAQQPASSTQKASAQLSHAELAHGEDGASKEPAPTKGPGETSFGRPLRDGTAEVALATLLATPDTYAGQHVRTRGVVARVCQAMGCWLELRAGSGKGQLRAPMAGHAFFVPKTLVGQTAVVEGTVRVEPLTDAQKAHYRSEGMQAVDVAVSLDAEAVVVAGS